MRVCPATGGKQRIVWEVRCGSLLLLMRIHTCAQPTPVWGCLQSTGTRAITCRPRRKPASSCAGGVAARGCSKATHCCRGRRDPETVGSTEGTAPASKAKLGRRKLVLYLQGCLSHAATCAYGRQAQLCKSSVKALHKIRQARLLKNGASAQHAPQTRTLGLMTLLVCTNHSCYAPALHVRVRLHMLQHTNTRI